MVRICKGLYINPLTVAFFIVCYLSGKTAFFLISYMCMTLHELAHFASACFIGLKPSHISFHPFGVNLKLKTTIVCGVAEDIILYLSGPFINLIAALIFITVYKGRYMYDYGFAVNIMLCFVNLLPICPLDGGNIAKRMLGTVTSESSANTIMKSVSGFLSAMVFVIGVYVVWITGYNYSVIFISVLLFANIFTVREKYSETAIKNLVFQKRLLKNKNGKPVRMFVADSGFVPANFLKHIRPGVFTCVAVLDDNGEIEKVISEKEIIKML